MKRLIVNADDLGCDAARNAGIFEAIEAGAVTSVSILANGPALDDAVCRIGALHPGAVSPGLHFNISEGRPVSSGLRIIVGSDGHFLGKKTAHNLLLCRTAQLEAEIRKELISQISTLAERGVQLNHLDGHQHVHVFPAVMRVVADEAKARRIPWIRIPEEQENRFEAGGLSAILLEENRTFSTYAKAARTFLDASGIHSTDHFRGLYLKGRLRASLWRKLMESVHHGLTELMVHPGRVPGKSVSGPFSSFSNPDRERELEALIDKRFRLALLNGGVELTQFPEASI